MNANNKKMPRRLPAALTLLFVWVCLSAVSSGTAVKSPGSTYCIKGVCYRVQTLDEMRARIGLQETVRASFYDDCQVDIGNPCTALSSGEKFQPDRADNAASPVYPNGTVLIVSNPKTNRSARVRINNSGPYFKGRLLDVSRATAELLGFIDAGTAQLKVKSSARPQATSRSRVATLG